MALKAIILISITAVVLCMASPSNAQGTCQTVANSLLPCRTYLQKGGDLPAACCDGVSSLNKATSTTANRKAVCQCLKTLARSNNVNPQYASGLPASCKVNIPYPISYSTNCDAVH